MPPRRFPATAASTTLVLSLLCAALPANAQGPAQNPAQSPAQGPAPRPSAGSASTTATATASTARLAIAGGGVPGRYGAWQSEALQPGSTPGIDYVFMASGDTRRRDAQLVYGCFAQLDTCGFSVLAPVSCAPGSTLALEVRGPGRAAQVMMASCVGASLVDGGMRHAWVPQTPRATEIIMGELVHPQTAVQLGSGGTAIVMDIAGEGFVQGVLAVGMASAELRGMGGPRLR
jgi:hypothetical protein